MTIFYSNHKTLEYLVPSVGTCIMPVSTAIYNIWLVRDVRLISTAYKADLNVLAWERRFFFFLLFALNLSKFENKKLSSGEYWTNNISANWYNRIQIKLSIDKAFGI